MKIVKLEDFHADGGWDTYSFLKITTDEGLAGWSEYNESRRRGMTQVIHGLGAGLIGKDPRAIGRIDRTVAGARLRPMTAYLDDVLAPRRARCRSRGSRGACSRRRRRDAARDTRSRSSTS